MAHSQPQHPQRRKVFLSFGVGEAGSESPWHGNLEPWIGFGVDCSGGDIVFNIFESPIPPAQSFNEQDRRRKWGQLIMGTKKGQRGGGCKASPLLSKPQRVSSACRTAVSPSRLPQPSSPSMSPPCLCLWVLSSSYKDTSHWIYSLSIQYDLISPWPHLQRPHFFIRSHSGTRSYDLVIYLGGTHQPTTSLIMFPLVFLSRALFFVSDPLWLQQKWVWRVVIAEQGLRQWREFLD